MCIFQPTEAWHDSDLPCHWELSLLVCEVDNVVTKQVPVRPRSILVHPLGAQTPRSYENYNAGGSIKRKGEMVLTQDL